MADRPKSPGLRSRVAAHCSVAAQGWVAAEPLTSPGRAEGALLVVVVAAVMRVVVVVG